MKYAFCTLIVFLSFFANGKEVKNVPSTTYLYCDNCKDWKDFGDVTGKYEVDNLYEKGNYESYVIVINEIEKIAYKVKVANVEDLSGKTKNQTIARRTIFADDIDEMEDLYINIINTFKLPQRTALNSVQSSLTQTK